MINIFWQIPNGHGRFWLEWSFPARNSAWRSDINISMKLHSVNLQDREKVVKSFGTPKMMVWYGYGSVWQIVKIVKIVERLENSDEMLDRSIQFDMLAKFLLCRWYVIRIAQPQDTQSRSEIVLSSTQWGEGATRAS